MPTPVSGNTNGPFVDKPFREALRMEIAAAGPDHKKLRRIARRRPALLRRPHRLETAVRHHIVPFRKIHHTHRFVGHG